ncbi:adenylate cyclase [Histoplasma capsulatum]|uniref:Adenylate cyclase n=1 Tax=Ajellomyces capsulatus TaxID=5037 RepID=A0A8A1M5M3_AJECA|nr:adenylate cyclase [Histoplasma capsulatum]
MARRQRPQDRDLRQGSESSSAGSWRSHDTATQGDHSHGLGQASTSRHPVSVRTSGSDPRLRPIGKPRSSSRSNRSARSTRSANRRSYSPDVSPTDMKLGFGSHRKALALLGAAGYPPAIFPGYPPRDPAQALAIMDTTIIVGAKRVEISPGARNVSE